MSTETSEHARTPEEWEGSAPKKMKESENPDQRWGHFSLLCPLSDDALVLSSAQQSGSKRGLILYRSDQILIFIVQFVCPVSTLLWL